MAHSVPDFHALQYELTAHIRDPDNCPAPVGVEDRRLGIYRELLYNNVEGFMARSFPVLRSILPDARWHSMMRNYFSRHRARTPLFPRLAQEFLLYLAQADKTAIGPVFLAELAHYEWLELEAFLDNREIDEIETATSTNCLDGIPILNPIARVQSYTFDVHRISPEYQPQEPPVNPTYLVVYRNREDDVRFMELNAVTARLLEVILQESARPGRVLLKQIAHEMAHPDPAVVVAGGQQIMEELISKNVILGALA
jgi:hypothetical protein